MSGGADHYEGGLEDSRQPTRNPEPTLPRGSSPLQTAEHCGHVLPPTLPGHSNPQPPERQGALKPRQPPFTPTHHLLFFNSLATFLVLRPSDALLSWHPSSLLKSQPPVSSLSTPATGSLRLQGTLRPTSPPAPPGSRAHRGIPPHPAGSDSSGGSPQKNLAWRAGPPCPTRPETPRWAPVPDGTRQPRELSPPCHQRP